MSTPSRLLLGMRVDSVGPEEALSTVLTWSRATRARVVCAANVHMIMEAVDDPGFRSIVNSADLVVPDGVPTVWALRALGVPCTGRVRVTPDWLFGLFSRLEVSGGVLSLYGGSQETLGIFKRQLTKHFPRLRLGASVLPPFRPMTDVEDATAVQEIVAADTSVLLVGIGCPKQERWMAEHRDSVPCVMIGVGAAFDLLGGRYRLKPRGGCETEVSSGPTGFSRNRRGCGGATLFRTLDSWRFSSCRSFAIVERSTSHAAVTLASILVIVLMPCSPLDDEDEGPRSQSNHEDNGGVAHDHPHRSVASTEHQGRQSYEHA